MLDILYQLAQPLLDQLAAFWQVVLALLTAILGLVLLLRGRKLYWFFIAMVGFFLGLYLGFRFVEMAGWLRWLIILGMGVLFAGLARMAQKLMAVIAAALVLASIGYLLPPAGWPTAVRYLSAAILGLIGASLALRVFDWALIIGSAVLGAWLINGVLPVIADISRLPPVSGTSLTLGLAGLTVLGIVVQALSLPRRRLL